MHRELCCMEPSIYRYPCICIGRRHCTYLGASWPVQAAPGAINASATRPCSRWHFRNARQFPSAWQGLFARRWPSRTRWPNARDYRFRLTYELPCTHWWWVYVKSKGREINREEAWECRWKCRKELRAMNQEAQTQAQQTDCTPACLAMISDHSLHWPDWPLSE